MPDSKRIIVSVPADLLIEVDKFTQFEHKNRSEIVREAIIYYLGERKKATIIEQMKKGYLEMAEINLGIASEDNHNGVNNEVPEQKALE